MWKEYLENKRERKEYLAEYKSRFEFTLNEIRSGKRYLDDAVKRYRGGKIAFPCLTFFAQQLLISCYEIREEFWVFAVKNRDWLHDKQLIAKDFDQIDKIILEIKQYA
jgi:hypothetical protein